MPLETAQVSLARLGTMLVQQLPRTRHGAVVPGVLCAVDLGGVVRVAPLLVRALQLLELLLHLLVERVPLIAFVLAPLPLLLGPCRMFAGLISIRAPHLNLTERACEPQRR